MKLTRNSKIFINYFLGPLLFCWLFWSIYQQIAHQPGLKQAWWQIINSWGTEKLMLVAATLGLMLINWALEAYKWKIAVHPVQEVSFINSLQAIFSGVSFSVTTPNRVGEYVGRLMYVKEGSRLRTISVSIVGSMSQLIITLLFGLIGLIVLRGRIIDEGMINGTWMQVVLSGVSLVLLGLLLCYFRLNWIVHLLGKIRQAKKLFYLIEAVEQLDRKILLRMLLLSLSRFLVFGLQYYIFFYLFEVNIGLLDSFWTVNVSFLVMAVIPTIAIAELAQRGKVIITLAGLFSANHLGITLATAAVWLVNLILPALIGSLLTLKKRKLVTT
jgi:uncharacterized membrane protein YbhN (UPF0104 family)